MKVPGNFLGKTGTCPKCGRRIPISEKNARPLPELVRSKPAAGPLRPFAPDLSAARTGERLVNAGLISQKQLDEALDIQDLNGGRIGEILVSLGHIDVRTFADFLATLPDREDADLSDFQTSPELLSLISKELASEYNIFPIDRLGRNLVLGAAYPLEPEMVATIEDLTRLRLKVLLCSQEDIRSLIARYYTEAIAVEPQGQALNRALQGTLKMENVAALLRNISLIPALPDTVERVREAMADPDISIQEVVSIIETDPPVAAKLLAVANSAAYGFPNRVDSVKLAATLLGMNETYTLVLSSAVVGCFEQSARFNYRALWAKAMDCANIATSVAKVSGLAGTTGIFAAALLHDIGRVALMEAAPQRYARIEGGLRGLELVMAEQEALGITHPEAGFVLASNWNLPVQIVEPMRFHHAFGYAREASSMTAIITVAAALNDAMVAGEHDLEFPMTNASEAISFLSLDTYSLATVARECLPTIALAAD
jgi:HD-like signal output (HDOD) protein